MTKYNETERDADSEYKKAHEGLDVIDSNIDEHLKEIEGLHQHIEHLNEHLEKVCRMRDSYAKTLQEVCIQLARVNHEKD